MYNINMKQVIEKILQLDILNIETKSGYNGADLLVLSSTNEQHINLMKSIVNVKAIQTKIFKEEAHSGNNETDYDIYYLYSVFSEDKIPERDFYELKPQSH